MASLASRQDELLRAVDARWLPLFDLDALATALAAIDAAGDAARTAPVPELIFEAFRYGAPADCGAVIVAQEPYSNAGDAQGLCFSVPAGTRPPQSLARVFGCLERAKLRTGRVDPETKAAIKESGDLRCWAVQGVLMLNATLTTRVGCRRQHAAAWAPFVREFVRRFCAERAAADANVPFLLWGGSAREFAPVVVEHGHWCLEWSPPSTLADSKLPPSEQFIACPHFAQVNATRVDTGRRAIVWDNRSPAIAFSDGSCPRNGAPDARASFAAIITGGHFGACIVRGEVQPFTYEFVDDDNPERGVQATGTPAVPTNNRGELLGIIYCLLAALLGRAAGRFELISDSKISVQTLLEWLPGRRRKGTAHQLKNYDLVVLAERLLAQVRAATGAVALTHTRSHQREPAASASARERFVWRGNDLADKHAEAVLANDDTKFVVEVINAPVACQALTA